MRSPIFLPSRAAIARAIAVCALTVAGTACSELGTQCVDDPTLQKRVQITPGSIDLVSDVVFENCSQLLCMSDNGSLPFCTIECASNLDCDREGFVCTQAVEFGPLACRNWTAEDGCSRDENNEIEQPIKYCTAPVSVINKVQGKDENFVPADAEGQSAVDAGPSADAGNTDADAGNGMSMP